MKYQRLGQKLQRQLSQAFFFNRYAALDATWVAGKLSFEFENLSFELLDSSFEIFNLSFDILDSIFVIHPVNWSQFPLFYEPKCLQFVKT